MGRVRRPAAFLPEFPGKPEDGVPRTSPASLKGSALGCRRGVEHESVVDPRTPRRIAPDHQVIFTELLTLNVLPGGVVQKAGFASR